MSSKETAQEQPQFNIEKLYVKDLSVEVPHSPSIFLEQEMPRVELKLNNESAKVSDDVYEVVVTAVVTAQLKDKVVFLIEAHHAGIFRLRNIPEGELEPALETLCPNIIYPYLREVVSECSVRAGFAPVLLNPVDFNALYAQKTQQTQASH